MWLGKPETRQEGKQTAQVGWVTLGGDPAGVYLDGERRSLPVYSPGGYCWRPTSDQQVLVVKAGADGEEPCLIGATQEVSNLGEGEIVIRSAKGAEIWFKSDGSLDLVGNVLINGVSLDSLLGSSDDSGSGGLV